MMRSAVDSSNISEVMWENETLFVLFKKNGITGAYYGVPAEKYNELISAPSAGKYLNSEIKPFFTYRELSTPGSGCPDRTAFADAVAGST